MESCRVFVFKEIQYADQICYQWFKLGEDDEDYIVPDVVLSYDEHWARVNAD